MIYCFDIDGTICTNTDGDYEIAEPYYEVIQKVNELYDAGHTIYYMTARGFTTKIDWFSFTEKQLNEWGACYNQLILGKPTADLYVDDKAINVRDWKKEVFDD